MSQTITTKTVNALSPDLLVNEIDSRIVKINPSSTPVDQISRLAGARPSGSMIVDYYSVDSKEIRDKVETIALSSDYQDSGEGKAYQIKFRSNKVFNETDTVLFPRFAYSSGEDISRKNPIVGFLSKKLDKPGEFIIVFANEEANTDDYDYEQLTGADAIRMGRAAGELDVQTPIFESVPKKERNYCQIFKSQIEQSTLVKIANKEVGWTFSDQEEIAIADMRRGMEKNFLFGQKIRLADPVRHEDIFFTGGIWNQAEGEALMPANFTLDDFFSLAKTVFVGNSGSNRRILIGGSDFITRLHTLENPQRTLGPRDYVTKWGIDFSEIHTKFGTFYVLLSETFDECGHPGDAMVIDPEYLTKYSHIPFQTETLDLRSAGIRNSDAVVVTEASCLVLRHPKSHFRVTTE